MGECDGQGTVYTPKRLMTENDHDDDDDEDVERGWKEPPEPLDDIDKRKDRAESRGGATDEEIKKREERKGETERNVLGKGKAKGQERGEGGDAIRVGFASRYFHSSHDVGIMVQGLLPALQDANKDIGKRE